MLGAAGTLTVGAMTDWSFKSEDILPLTEASVDILATYSAFGDGLKITTTTKAPTYSVGSILIEDKHLENLTFTYNWKEADGTQFNSILPSISDITLGEDGSGVFYDNRKLYIIDIIFNDYSYWNKSNFMVKWISYC